MKIKGLVVILSCMSCLSMPVQASGAEIEGPVTATASTEEVQPFAAGLISSYDSYCYPITNYLSGYKWYVKLSPYSGDSLNARFRIIDDKENEIIGYESENSIMALSNEKYKIINTKIGDMNYNGIRDREDATIIQNNLLGNISISTLQEKLVDANQNGSIDLADAVHILMNLEG